MIRQTLASNKYSIFMDIREKPNTPHPEMWHHFVECDGSLHRITRLALIRATSERPRLADKILNYETIPDAIKRVMESESNKPSIKHEHEINAVN
eukprot:gene20710-26850_t